MRRLNDVSMRQSPFDYEYVCGIRFRSILFSLLLATAMWVINTGFRGTAERERGKSTRNRKVGRVSVIGESRLKQQLLGQ